MTEKELCALAIKAAERSYSPYSACKVGSALLASSGKVYLGCNIENAAFSPTVCAERTAFFKAVSEGETEFEMIAVVGKKNGSIIKSFPPCGVCRQVMAEFCYDEFKVLLVSGENEFKEKRLSELLPCSFDEENVRG